MQEIRMKPCCHRHRFKRSTHTARLRAEQQGQPPLHGRRWRYRADVSGLRTRGGNTVSIAWHDGRLQSATILPKTSGTITVRSKTPLQQCRLVREYSDIGIYEYQLTVSANKEVKIK